MSRDPRSPVSPEIPRTLGLSRALRLPALLGLACLLWAAVPAQAQEIQVRSVTTDDGTGELAVPAGASLTVVLRGQNLHLIQDAAVILGRGAARGVTAELSPVNPRDRTARTVRQVTITADARARVAEGYRLRLVGRRGAADVATFRVVAAAAAPARRAAPTLPPERAAPPQPEPERTPVREAAPAQQETQVQSVTADDGSRRLGVPAGGSLTVTVRGQNLHLIQDATVLLGRAAARGVTAELAPVRRGDRTASTVRQVTITAEAGARAADSYRLRLGAAGRHADVATLQVTPAPAAARQPTPAPRPERAAPAPAPAAPETADAPARPAREAEAEALVVFRGQSASFELEGIAARRMDGVRVVDSERRPVVGVEATLGPARRTGREVTIAAARDASLGAYELEGLAGRRPMDLERRVYVVESAAAADAEARRRNMAEQSQRRTFARRGWTPVESEAPDPRVLALDPEAPQAALLHHMRTVALGGEAVGRLERLAAGTTDSGLRSGAIRALGASPDPEARAALVDLFAETRSTPVRMEILENLRPRSADEPAAQLLLQVGADRRIPQRTRAAAVSRAAAVGLAARHEVERASLLQEAPVALRSEIQDTRTRFYRGGAGSLVQEGGRFGFETAQRDAAPARDVILTADLATWLQQIGGEQSWWALKAVKDEAPAPATPAELADPGYYRQILFLPAGYTEEERDLFTEHVAQQIAGLGNMDEEEVWTAKYRDRIVYIAHWLPGDPLPAVDGSSSANFDARLYTHPTRGGLGLTANTRKVIEAVDSFRSQVPNFAPIAVAVVFNTEQEVTANAILPTLMLPQFEQYNASVRGYGIARVTRAEWVGTTMHELAHAGLNFLDEYFESYLADLSIDLLDGLNALVLFDGTWGGFGNSLESLIGHYAFRVSKALADMGADNISTERFPDMVDGTGLEYEAEGGMFFGRGVWHQSPSIMTWQDNIGYHGHPDSQRQILRQIFEGASPARANNRIQAAGPVHEWLPQFGDRVRVLLHDADKHHRWQPTTRYEVQVGYWEKVWTTCPVVVGGVAVTDFYGNPVTYPCTEDVWRPSVQSVTPSLRSVDLHQTLLSGMAGAVLGILTHYGLDSFELEDGQNFNFPASVDELGETALPSILWAVPYQEVEVEAPNPLTTYYWRFRTYNGSQWSGWTSWAEFWRAT